MSDIIDAIAWLFLTFAGVFSVSVLASAYVDAIRFLKDNHNDL